MKTIISESRSGIYFFSFFRTSLVIALLVFAAGNAFAQSASADKVLKGLVKTAEDNEPAPGVNIYLKSAASKGTYSDAKGYFVFPGPVKAGDIIVFSFIGLKTVEYVVPEHIADEVKILLDREAIEMVEEVLVDDAAASTVPAETSVTGVHR